jgi:hypothetical protein
LVNIQAGNGAGRCFQSTCCWREKTKSELGHARVRILTAYNPKSGLLFCHRDAAAGKRAVVAFIGTGIAAFGLASVIAFRFDLEFEATSSTNVHFAFFHFVAMSHFLNSFLMFECRES